MPPEVLLPLERAGNFTPLLKVRLPDFAASATGVVLVCLYIYPDRCYVLLLTRASASIYKVTFLDLHSLH